MTTDHPVSEIDGIGPATAERLAAIAVHTTDDLLRGSVSQIHAGVDDLTSTERVAAWRAMARLLQIPAMTGQWAEALEGAGIDRLSSVHSRDADELATIFETARAENVIPDVPDRDTLEDMIRDALEIELGGMLVGTVTDRDGVGLAGAEVRIGIRRAATDARGRFRLLRLAMGVPLRLTITRDGNRTLDVDDPPVRPYDDGPGVVSYALDPRPPGEPSPRLDEYDGDVLPRLTSHTMRSVRHDVSELREGDVFVLHKHYARTPDVLLASKFWAYEDGEFEVATYKVPLADLPPDAELRDHFVRRRGAFQRIRMSPSRFDLQRRLRRARRVVEGRPVPASVIEWDDRIRLHAQAVQDAGGPS